MLLTIAQHRPAGAEDRFEWQAISPAEADFDPALGDRLDAGFADGAFKGLHAVLVIRHGKLALERYYAGADERWGQPLGEVTFTGETVHDLRSVSKSIVGLAYGIALAEGKVPPLDTPLLDLFPQYADLAADPARRKITVEHALTMTMGTDWDEDIPYSDPRNSEIMMEAAPDRYRFILERPIVAEAGKRWTYSGGATALLGHLIARGTGQALDAYAWEKLMTPLGITAGEWVKGTNGEPAAASGLRLTPRDLARIGQMLVQGGTWQGRTIVPADWLKASFTSCAETGDGLTYGYQWWLGTRLGTSDNWAAGFGNGGQRLIVMPDIDLAIVILAGNYSRPGHWELPMMLMRDHIMPAFKG
jgi:CubicO group peptidase (beta-lactamase class C family)